MTLTDSDDMQVDEFREPQEPRKCRVHKWLLSGMTGVNGAAPVASAYCRVCGKTRDDTLSRRGKQSRNYGNRAELKVATKYGGTKIGHAGGPVDVQGKDFATQVKTHRRLPPAEWRKVFAAMAQSNRCPRLLLRFVQGPGLPPVDYFVFEADAFLNWFGKDE